MKTRKVGWYGQIDLSDPSPRIQQRLPPGSAARLRYAPSDIQPGLGRLGGVMGAARQVSPTFGSVPARQVRRRQLFSPSWPLRSTATHQLPHDFETDATHDKPRVPGSVAQFGRRVAAATAPLRKQRSLSVVLKALASRKTKGARCCPSISKASAQLSIAFHSRRFNQPLTRIEPRKRSQGDESESCCFDFQSGFAFISSRRAAFVPGKVQSISRIASSCGSRSIFRAPKCCRHYRRRARARSCSFSRRTRGARPIC